MPEQSVNSPELQFGAELDVPKVGDGLGLEPTQRLFEEELALALRNHSLPLEGLRYDVTPTGLHYTLVHYDIPEVDPASYSLEINGAVRTAMRLSLADLKSRPQQTLPVTIECAGDG